MSSKQEVFLQCDFERKIYSKAIFSMLHHVSGIRFDLKESVFNHCLNRDALPHRIKLTPARDAMNIHLNFCTRKFIEFIPRPAFFFVHLTPHTEIPSCRVKVWDGAIMQDRKLKCKCLSRR